MASANTHAPLRPQARRAAQNPLPHGQRDLLRSCASQGASIRSMLRKFASVLVRAVLMPAPLGIWPLPLFPMNLRRLIVHDMF
jgi:hypothetical protein